MLYESAANTVSLANIQQENRDFHPSKSGKKVITWMKIIIIIEIRFTERTIITSIFFSHVRVPLPLPLPNVVHVFSSVGSSVIFIDVYVFMSVY